MESKIDKLSDAVIALARMEERLVTVFNRMNKYDKKQEEMDEKVTELATHVSTNGQTLRFAERVFWILASGAISTAFWYFR
jgi:hypothetical protein